MSDEKEERKAESQKDTTQAGTNTEGSQDWLEKLGAVPPDQCYEDSPEIARIEEVLSTSDSTAAHPAKDETLENQFRRRACHHITREAHLESIKSNKDTMCPVKVTLEEAKEAFESTLTSTEKKMEVWTDYLPCHVCPKHYERGQELLKEYRLRKSQIEFLKEFDLWEESPISNPRYSDKRNDKRKESAKRLEKQKLIRIRLRFWGNPAKPGKPELTLMAKLSISGHLRATTTASSLKRISQEFCLKTPWPW